LGKTAWIEVLLRANPKQLNIEFIFYNETSLNLLDIACISGQALALHSLLRAAACTQINNSSKFFKFSDHASYNLAKAIYLAIYNSHPNCLKRLLNFIEKFNYKNKLIYRIHAALISEFPDYFALCCKRGYKKCIDFLVSNDIQGSLSDYCNIVDKSIDDFYAIDFCAKHGFADTIEALLGDLMFPESVVNSRAPLLRSREIADKYSKTKCVELIDSKLEEAKTTNKQYSP